MRLIRSFNQQDEQEPVYPAEGRHWQCGSCQDVYELEPEDRDSYVYYPGSQPMPFGQVLMAGMPEQVFADCPSCGMEKGPFDPVPTEEPVDRSGANYARVTMNADQMYRYYEEIDEEAKAHAEKIEQRAKARVPWNPPPFEASGVSMAEKEAQEKEVAAREEAERLAIKRQQDREKLEQAVGQLFSWWVKKSAELKARSK